MDFHSRSSLLLLLSLFSIVTLFTRLDAGYLPSYDDAYYAQKAREILRDENWLTMNFAGQPTFDNPPGFMWLIAGSFKIFGVSEFAARWPAAIGGLLGILGTFFLFELLLGTRIGFLSAVILSLTSVYLKYSRHAMMDTTVTAACVWCFYCFFRAMRGSQWWFLAAGIIGSYIFFAKSAFGAFPVIALLVYLLVFREWRVFKRPGFWLATLILILPYSIWCLHQYYLFNHDFIDRHFVKLILTASAQRGANDYWYDYIVVLLKYFPVFLPFMLLGLVLTFRAQGGDTRKAYGFGLIYFSVFLIFLSLQGTKKTWYFIPALPACASLAAVGLSRVLQGFSTQQLAKGFATLAVAVFILFMTTPIQLSKARAVDIRKISPYVRAATQQGFNVLGFGIDYFGLNNSLLFYSDEAARPVDKEQLSKELSTEGSKVAVVISPQDWLKVQGDYSQLKIVRETEGWIFLVNAELDQRLIF